MTAIVLPDIDRSTLEELKKRIPDLSEIELPNLPSRKEVGRADYTLFFAKKSWLDRSRGFLLLFDGADRQAVVAELRRRIEAEGERRAGA